MKKRFVEHERCVDIEEYTQAGWVVVSCSIKLIPQTKTWSTYSKYGMTEKDYNDLLELQNKKCAICGRTSKKKLVVDHDHNSNVIRGLLCNSCNVGIGMMKDSIKRMKSAIKYLSGKHSPNI